MQRRPNDLRYNNIQSPGGVIFLQPPAKLADLQYPPFPEASDGVRAATERDSTGSQKPPRKFYYLKL